MQLVDNILEPKLGGCRFFVLVGKLYHANYNRKSRSLILAHSRFAAGAEITLGAYAEHFWRKCVPYMI